jgi:glycosyltransferase involved in cell wall biosynthesis
MDYPKISIVTPNYNMAPFLEQTICSVLNQGYPNLEYIIIDGGSTDGSVDIIRKYESQLAYWVSEPDQGLYHAIQKGFERSTGEIMAWLNSDDIYHYGALSIVAEIFSSISQVQWLSGTPTCIDTKGRTVLVAPLRVYSRYMFLTTNKFEWIQQESTFWRRSLWVQAGGRLSSEYALAGDFELWMRFFRHTQPIVINALLGGFRVRLAGQKSFDGEKQYEDEAQRIVERELAHLSEKERFRHKKIRLYQWLAKYPLLAWATNANKKLDWLMDYTKVVTYYRIQQRFVPSIRP